MNLQPKSSAGAGRLFSAFIKKNVSREGNKEEQSLKDKGLTKFYIPVAEVQGHQGTETLSESQWNHPSAGVL